MKLVTRLGKFLYDTPRLALFRESSAYNLIYECLYPESFVVRGNELIIVLGQCPHIHTQVHVYLNQRVYCVYNEWLANKSTTIAF